MGVPGKGLTRDGVVCAHVASMRSYADTLAESDWPLVSRAKVIARVRKCAAEVERSYALAQINEARQGQSPNGGDTTKIETPALLTGPARKAGDAQKDPA